MSLLTPEIRAKLIANGKSHGYDHAQQINNVPPVCFIYYEGSGMCWLLTEIDRNRPNLAWGIIDMGDGRPDFGSFSLDVIEGHHHDGIGTETSNTPNVRLLQGWEPQGMLSNYISAAGNAGRIVELDGRDMPLNGRHDARPLSGYSDAEMDAFLAATPQVKAPFLGLTRFIIGAGVRRLLGLGH